MPPPVTPSPHRFISGHHRKSVVAKDEAKKPSVLQNSPDIDPDLRPQKISSKQFTAKPHNLAATPKSAEPDRAERPSLAQALRSSTQRREDVEEAPSQSPNDDDELLMPAGPNVIPSIETEQSTTTELRPPKRTHEAVSDSGPAYPVFRHAQTPASHTKPLPKFTVPQSDPTEISARPAFLRSSTDNTGQPLEPVPEAFSPRRSAQKFLAGGAAATVHQWVLEIGQEVAQSRRAQAYTRGEDYVIRARIDELQGEGPWTAMASVDGGPDLTLLLPGDGNQVEGLRVGCMIGARTPTWEIELDGVMWTVVVDWKVL